MDIILKMTKKKSTLDYIRTIKPKRELADNIERAMLETRKGKLRKSFD